MYVYDKLAREERGLFVLSASHGHVGLRIQIYHQQLMDVSTKSQGFRC
jgi:hypothetical protein